MSTRIKICGITCVEDAVACVDAGANAIGLNFVPSSVRLVDVDTAKEIALAVGSRTLVVGVVANMTALEMKALATEVGLGCLQLHGDEPHDVVAAMLPHAYKAVRIADESDVIVAQSYPGDYLLVDARVAGALGGTGTTFDWSLVTGLARTRKLTLAGGLTSDNVAEAIRVVSPYCVDVASGVESAPRRKDSKLVGDFVRQVRGG